MRSSWKAACRIASVLAIATAAIGASARDAAAETLSLSQAIEIGLKSSPQVRGAKARTESADAGIGVAKAGYLPQLQFVTGSLAYNAQSFDGSSKAAIGQNGALVEFATRRVTYTTSVPSASARVRWNVWDFGKTSNGVSAAEGFRDVATANEQETTLQTSASIASAYLNLFYQERLLDVANATLLTRDKLNAITKGLVKSGLQPPMEEIRALSRLEASRRDVERAKAATEDARTQLAIALGMEPSAAIKVTTPKLPRLPQDTAAAVKDADEKRPQLAAARQTVTARQAAKDQTVATLMPTLFVQGDANLSIDHPDNLDFRQVSKGASAQVGLSATFDFSTFSRIDQAAADLAAAEADLEAARRDTKSDAARAVISVKATAAQLEHAKKTEEGTQAVHAIVEARYIRGLSSPIELIDAEDSDIDARVQRVQTELDHALAVVRLCVATGRPITEDSAQ